MNSTEGRRGVAAVLKELFLKMDALQQKWLVRILLKEMKISIGHKAVLNAFHRIENVLFKNVTETIENNDIFVVLSTL